jgi:hypothetical protein
MRRHLEREFLPEAVCIGLIRASIKANCRTLSQAWIGHARRRIGARDRHAANSAGLPMLPSQRIGIAIGGLGGSIQAFDKRRGFSSDMGKSAIDDQKDHAPGSGEQAFQKAMKTEAVTPPIR